MAETEFKEKARKLIFNCDLRHFPTIFEMYLRSFNLTDVDRDKAMGEVIVIIRTSADADTAYTMVCHYLDSLEES